MNTFTKATLSVVTAALLAVGGAAAANASTVDGSLAKGSTGVHMTIVNNTGQTLNLLDASDTGHWQKRPLTTLQPGQTEEVTNYSDSVNGAQILLDYTMQNDGSLVQMDANAPLTSFDSATGDFSNSSHTMDIKPDTGFHPHDIYTLN